jgi:hypothetical protein
VRTSETCQDGDSPGLGCLLRSCWANPARLEEGGFALRSAAGVPMRQDPKPRRILRVGKDGVLRIPRDIVAAERLGPGDQVDAASIRLGHPKDVAAAERLGPGDQVDAGGIRRRKDHLGESFSGRRLRLIIFTITLGVVGALGGLLIDWPPFTAFQDSSAYWINLTAFLFPLGWIVITRTAQITGAEQFISLLLGLFYGGVLWLQVILEVFLRTSMGETKKWDYLQGHIYDLFAVAAIVGAVGYYSFSVHRKWYVRMAWLAGVFALAGAITGFTEAEMLWANNGLPGYHYWALPILWALTGIWFGACVGYEAPKLEVAKVLRGEPSDP